MRCPAPRVVLDDVLPGYARARDRHDDQCGAAYDDGDERRRRAAQGTASGINNAASRIAGLLAVALLGALAFGLFEPALAERLAGLDLPAATRAIILEQSRAAASLELPATLDGATAGGVRAAVKQSFVEGLRTVMLATAAAAAASAMVAAAMSRGRPATAAS